MIPQIIRHSHVMQAVRFLDRAGEAASVRRYALVVDDRRYPAKHVVALASRIAGADLPFEAFSGGTETNAFLRRLGFRVDDTLGASPLRVGRVVMDMGVTMRELSAIDSDGWAAHRRVVREQFRSSRSFYLERISGLIDDLSRANVDVAMFPALAFTHDADVPFRRYSTLCKRIPLVVAGDFRLLERGKFERGLVVLRAGERVRRYAPTDVARFSTEKATFFGAISSTIKLVGESTPATREAGQRAMVLDCGHRQYNGRYVKVMKRAAREAASIANAAAICPLAFWRYAGGRNDYDWVEGTDGAAWRVLPAERRACTPPNDSVDVIEVR